MTPFNEDSILNFLRNKDYQPCKSRELAKEMAIPDEDYSTFRSLLKEMQHSDTLTRIKGGRWTAPTATNAISGRLQVTRQGFGFLVCDDARLDDIFIPENEMGAALNNDRVSVKLQREGRGRGGRHFGSIIEILERSLKRVVGVYKQGRKSGVCVPEDNRIPESFNIEARETSPDCHEDDKVLLEITTWPEPGKRGSGFILERLGPAGAPDTETAAILANFEAPGPFPEEVLEQVHALDPTISDEEMAQRLDLRKLITFTIDPDTARDFDDAISLEREMDGYTLGVHIADVSHYVTPGSALDREALERSTSIYLPDRVIPMIPPELSNDLCSLRPQENRLALSVFTEINAEGKIGKSWCARSVIHSTQRLTYRETRDLLESDALAESFENKEVLSRLRSLRTLADKLRKGRAKNGSIELILPEYKVIVDDEGKATGMQRVEHDFSHQMVEECMLVANVATAELAVANLLPVLYRVHDAPSEEDLSNLAEFLNDCGYKFKLPFNNNRLNKILNKVSGAKEEHAINLAVLRAMQQAVYSPERRGHFALAFDRYTHFTSPIRRYPDLRLHQVLKSLFPVGENRLPERLKGMDSRGSSPELVMLGMHASGRERRAMKIEEGVKDLRRLELLAQCDKKIHSAIVTGIQKFGIFVELADFYVDGLLHRTEVAKKGITFVEVLPSEGGEAVRAERKQQRRSFKSRDLKRVGVHLGQEILVAVREVNLRERKCELEYIGLPEDD